MSPPRWTRIVVHVALPCDPMRDSVIGDLHEEFARDVQQCGARRARARHRWRTAGIVTHGLADALLWRSWVSTTPAPGASGAGMTAGADAASSPALAARRTRGAGGHAAFVLLAVGVLLLAVIGNTIAYGAAAVQGGRTVSTLGVAGLVLLVACVAAAALLMCAAPRRRGK